jgi:hypothetical protein
MAEEVVVIDATIGGETTNSYLTLIEAESYIHARPFHDAWDEGSLTDNQKNAALIWATRILSHYSWTGSYVTEIQALPWPRDGVYNKDGKAYLTTAYPEWLKVSCAELALSLITSDRLGDTGTEGFSKIKIDVLDLTIDKNDRPQWIPDYILKAINYWFKNGGSTINRPVMRA